MNLEETSKEIQLSTELFLKPIILFWGICTQSGIYLSISP